MTIFKANFNYFPQIVAAPAKIEFEDASVIGDAQENEFTLTVDNAGNNVTVSKPYSEYTIGRIEQREWLFSDGTVSSDITTTRNFEFAGEYEIIYSIYSNLIFDDVTGKFFRFKNFIVKKIILESMTVSWLKQHMIQPQKEAYETSQGWKDLINSTSKMFDRMYKEIKEVANLIDIKKVDARFLEYFSDTFGHEKFYAKKIGYSTQAETDDNYQKFLEYDIFEKIKTGVATDLEIEFFRTFIIDTSAMFKEKGSPESISSFFELYDFIIKVKELWTTNFGITTDQALNNDFIESSTLTETPSRFQYNGIFVNGLDNSKLHLFNTFNSITLDNYHFVSTHTFQDDRIQNVDCTSEFEIHDYYPNVIKIIREDGRDIYDIEKCSNFDPESVCTSGITEDTAETILGDCVEQKTLFRKNEDWIYSDRVLEGTTFKFWNAPDGYVKSVINTVGFIPNGVDEIEEIGNLFDSSDDYLWADWKFGVTVPPTITGVSQSSMRRPSLVKDFTVINFSTTQTNSNLIQREDVTIPTIRDFFTVSRGFIQVRTTGYYAFSLDIGNLGNETDSQHVGLFSLKHNTVYTKEDVNTIQNLNDITFSRNGDDNVYTLGTSATGNTELYGKVGEYGIIEIRQNEKIEKSGYYYLTPGFYAYELKASYSSQNAKRLKLYWEAIEEKIQGSKLILSSVINKSIIPDYALYTLKSNIDELNIEDTIGKGRLILPNSVFEGGDKFKVVYTKSNSTSDHYSGIVSSKVPMYKDLEIETRFAPLAITKNEELNNKTIPQKKVMIFFRAISTNKNLYSDYDNFYALIINGLSGEMSLAEIGYNEETDGEYYRYLNLNSNSNLDNREFTKSMIDEINQITRLDDNKYYDIKLRVEKNIVNVWFKVNTEFTELINNVKTTKAQNVLEYKNSEEYIHIIKDVTLDQEDAYTQIFDEHGRYLEVAEPYIVNNNVGQYGFAIQSSIFNLIHFNVKPLDKTDSNLLETVDKWKQIKPKYLDSRSTDLLQFNSYEVSNVEKPINPSFQVQVSDSFDGENNKYPMPKSFGMVDDNVINKVIANNVNITKNGTRFNIFIDKNFVQERFNSPEQVLEGLAVPFGSFYEPYINWSELQNAESYTNFAQGLITPFISAEARLLPHTMSIDGVDVSYPTEMTRSIGETTVVLDGYVKDLLSGTTGNIVNGLWEELCPQSASDEWNIPSPNNITVITNSPNEVFKLIYKNKDSKEEVIGVRVIDSLVLEKLICRFCENAIVWGLYEITLPSYATQANPWLTTQTSTITTIKYFIPIGKLNKDFVFYLPSPEILRNDKVKVNLKGVYALQPTSTFTPDTTLSNWKIEKLNDWELKYKSNILCNYFIDVQTSLIDTITDYNIPLDKKMSTLCSPGTVLVNSGRNSPCDIPNTFLMPDRIVNILDHISNKRKEPEYTLEQFNDDFNWWNPKRIMTRRKFSIVYPENTDEILYSGLNSPNSFYTNDEVLTGEQGIKIVFEDNYNMDPGKYIADMSWCVNSTSWDDEFASSNKNEYGVGIFDLSASANIGFDEDFSKFIMGTEKLIPLGEFMGSPIPFATILNSQTGLNEIRFGTYYDEQAGVAQTFNPVGLYNWFLTHSNRIGFNNPNENSKIGWDITDLNDEFVNGVKIKSIYGEIDSGLYEINKYWAFYNNKTPPFGSIIKLDLTDRHCANIDTVNAPIPSDEVRILGVSDGEKSFYEVPVHLENYLAWSNQLNYVYADNYLVPSDYYFTTYNEVTENSELTLNTQIFDFSDFIGDTEFVIDLFYDKLFKTGEQRRFVDNYNNIRDVNWVTLIEENDYYKIAKRLPDTEIKYTGNSLPYSITTYNNLKAFKLINKFDYDNPNKFSGVENKESSVGIGSNGGSINVIQLTDIESNNFTISCDVIFDAEIVNTDYKKNFELILKAENNFTKLGNDWGITDFYYVGIGTNDWDVSLGMRSIDPNTGELSDTLLVSWGDFNIRNISSDTWYTLKAVVTNTEIKVFMNEKNEQEKLIINYNINKKYEKFTERYLKGEFETLQAVVIGLKELGLTYPDKLGDSVSSEYTFEKFKEQFAGTLPINGYYSGFRVFNPMTYVTNFNYVANIPKLYKFGSTFDSTSYNSVLNEIKTRFAPSETDVVKIDYGLNYTFYILLGDKLFYKYQDNEPELYPRPVLTFYIEEDKIIIVEKLSPTDSGDGLNYWSPGSHTIIWSYESNTQNIVQSIDFFNSIKNLQSVLVKRNGFEYFIQHNGTEIDGESVILAIDDEVILTIGGSENIIWPIKGVLSRYNTFVRLFEEGFIKEYPILIKDNTLYSDNLKSYMEFSDKHIKSIHVKDKKIHIIFEDN